jgi:hypothetical protein
MDHTTCIETYIQAKDCNRAHRMPRAFAADARLNMEVKTDAIAFPAEMRGVDAIAETLASAFGKRYENVYTFCIGAAPSQGMRAGKRYECDWLVCMSEKDSGLARVGYGRYIWTFESEQRGPVTGLTIVIEEMAVLPPETRAAVLQWASALPYPWCPVQHLEQAPPALDAVARVVAALQQSAMRTAR